MPQSKIDSKCFNLTKKVDKFLSLSNVSRTDLTPSGFWKELASNEEAVSRLVQSVRDNDTVSWSELAMSLQAKCGELWAVFRAN